METNQLYLYDNSSLNSPKVTKNTANEDVWQNWHVYSAAVVMVKCSQQSWALRVLNNFGSHAADNTCELTKS